MPNPLRTIDPPIQTTGPTDICKTQVGPATVPLPYPNIGVPTMCDQPVATVLFANGPAINLDGKIPMTNGDQAGAIGGVLSSMIMGQLQFMSTMAPTVKVGGSPAVTTQSPTMQNKENTPGMVMTSTAVTIMLGA
ncbi:DUF4150 domain-containing protein [Francisellaceae bacterium]|nr:DUF4150 domain-containing protein [Francisellaceae bacterium]